MEVEASDLPVQCLWQADCLLGEGPLWDHRSGTLYFVDIKGDELLAYNGQSGTRRAAYAGSPSAIALLDAEGDLLCASTRGVERYCWADGDRQPVAHDLSLQPGMRTNDGGVDARGRFWVGTMDDEERDFKGQLLRLSSATAVDMILDGVGVSNGLGWSPEGDAFYYTDSLRGVIWRFAFDAGRGAVSNRTIFAEIAPEEGAPDGLTVDAEGGVWTAIWDGGHIRRYLPDGTLERLHPVPAPRPTALAFGGPDLTTLFVTSARIGLSQDALAAAPLSGALFACRPGVGGLPASIARGF